MSRHGLCVAVVGSVFVVFGCAKSDSGTPRAQVAKGGIPLVPTATPQVSGQPRVELGYVADQTQVKVVAGRTVSYEPLETFRRTGEEQSGKESDASEVPAEDGAETAEADGGASEATADAQLGDPRAVVVTVPAHPRGLKGPQIDQVREAATAAARQDLIRNILAVRLDEATRVSDAADSSAASANWRLVQMQVVGMKWLDDSTLEVEVQVPVRAAQSDLEFLFEGVDWSGLAAIDPKKCVEGKGTAKLKESAATPAGPGEQARRASEGLGL